MTIPDAAVDDCTANHDRRDEDCEYCDVRADWRFCGHCGATYDGGVWYPDAHSLPCDHQPALLVDDFGNELAEVA